MHFCSKVFLFALNDICVNINLQIIFIEIGTYYYKKATLKIVNFLHFQKLAIVLLKNRCTLAISVKAKCDYIITFPKLDKKVLTPL